MRRVAIYAALGLVALLVAGCGPAIHREFDGISFDGAGTFYPGEEVRCEKIEDCYDVLAEVDGFINEHDRGRGPAASVTLHEPATADGRVGIMRSGGTTWVAVVTFGDGSRTSLIVGCGMGIAQERCFSQVALGRAHDSDGPER